MLLILVVIFGEKDGVIDLCINQHKKKDTQSNTLNVLSLPVMWGSLVAPLFYFSVFICVSKGLALGTNIFSVSIIGLILSVYILCRVPGGEKKRYSK